MANKFKLRINPTQSKAGRPRNELTESEKESLRNVLDKPDIIFVTRGRKDQRYVGKVDGKSQYVQKWYLMWILNYLLNTAKNIRELSWMSHRVICFWFLYRFSFFHFGFLWYSSFVINFSLYFKRLFRPTKILLIRHSQNNFQMWL